MGEWYKKVPPRRACWGAVSSLNEILGGQSHVQIDQYEW